LLTIPFDAADQETAPTIPGYDVLGLLGRGGMGVVYQALHVRLRRVVALKMIRTGPDAKPEELARFRTETEAVAALQHPGIVQIYEVGEYEGRPYCALEYVEGGSLAQQLTDKPQPAAEAARIVESVARAVHYAHERGIVHRDLKPGNILLTGLLGQESAERTQSSAELTLPVELGLPTPKITDFGVAKRLECDAGHTRTGEILGTPYYMAPEQAAGRKDVGPAADIHALGAILYKMLIGRPPFEGESPLDTLDQVRSAEPVALIRLRPKLPRDLETICLKCLAKEPQRRYSSAAALADDLGRFLDGRPIRARPIGAAERSWRWGQRRPAIAGLLLALALTFTGGCVGVLVQWRRAAALAEDNGRARDRAEAYYRRARDVVDRIAQVGDELADHPGVDRARAAVLEEVLSFYQSFLQERGNDPAARREVARAALGAGTVRRELGRFEPALAALRQAGELFDGLLAESPNDVGLRGERADCHLGEGHVFKATARYAEALAPYSRTIAIREGLSAEFPDVTDHAAKLAYALTNWSGVRRRSGPDEADEAGQTLLRAAGILRPILAADPGRAGHRLAMALLLEEMGRQHEARGRATEAEVALREALSLYHDLVRDRANAQWRYYVARTQRRLAVVLRGTDRLAEAETQCREAIALLERVIAEFPGNSAYRTALSTAYEELRLVFAALGRPVDEDELIRKALVSAERLASDFPNEPPHRTPLVLWRVRRADWLRRDGRDVEALSDYRRALEMQPNSVEGLNGLAWLRATSAEKTVRDPAEAVRLAEQAVALAPGNHNYWTTLGAARYRAGNAEGAISALERSLREKGGANGWNWFYLALARHQLGDLSRARAEFTRGADWFDEHRPKDAELNRLRSESEAAMVGPPVR
jgi:tetratricopeptide (TPR) repeat protein